MNKKTYGGRFSQNVVFHDLGKYLNPFLRGIFFLTYLICIGFLLKKNHLGLKY